MKCSSKQAGATAHALKKPFGRGESNGFLFYAAGIIHERKAVRTRRRGPQIVNVGV